MPNTSRDSIVDYIAKGKGTAVQQQLAQLRLDWSDIGTLRNTFVESVLGHERIYPTILPTQASGRWSYIDPALSGFPKKCINPQCPKYHHERTSQCWSLRDCVIPDEGTFWIEHDLDAVEHCIYALLLQWKERLNALKSGIDIHTPVTCSLFGLPQPSNLLSPHTSADDTNWRAAVRWQGKDDPRRTMSKNFTYGGQYFYVRLARRNEKVRKPYRICNNLWYNPSYVYSIPNIQSYKIPNEKGELVTPDFETLAIRFVENPENLEIQKGKAEVMEKCRKDKISRTLYGAPRYGWFANQDTAKALFNHIIQGTVVSYVNKSAIILQEQFPESYLVQNHHDSLKWAFRYSSSDRAGEELEILEQVKRICQRAIGFANDTIPITATFHVKRRPEDLSVV